MVHCKILRISLAFSVFQPWPCRGPSQASTYLLRICVPMSRNWRRSSLRSIVSALQSSYLTAQKHISPMYIIVNRCVSEKMPGRKHKRASEHDQMIQLKNFQLKNFLMTYLPSDRKLAVAVSWSTTPSLSFTEFLTCSIRIR